MQSVIPLALFAYARPAHLARTLKCLKENQVPLIYAFSDGPRSPDKFESVSQVRDLLRSVDWCKVILIERQENLGLGKSILTGVSDVLNKHDSVIVFEDDLICVPGTYQYLSTALKHYQKDSRVMSVTGWTHPRVTPSNVTDLPYFDGRAECLVWGTWARVWDEMKHPAMTLLEMCEARGIDSYRYGADLPAMAKQELQRNIWAVRFLYVHILNQALCLRPPWSMVEHIGYGEGATNAGDWGAWTNPPLQPCPLIPNAWPEPIENPECPHLAQVAFGGRPTKPSAVEKMKRNMWRVRNVVARILN